VPLPLQDGSDAVTFLTGVTVGTLVGSSESGTADGDAATARFSNPVSIIRITDTILVVADYDSSLLRRIDAGTGAVTSLPANASLSQPYGLAVLNGVLFAHTDKSTLGAKDQSTGTIWSIDTSLGTATVLGENLGRPRALTGLGTSQLLVGDDAHHVVNRFELASKVLSLVAGVQDCGGYADGPSSKAQFNGPAGVVVRSDGAFVVADAGNARIRLISSDGTVSTLAGDGVTATVDGPLNTARFVHPRAIAIDDFDNLYVSDDGAHRIRRVDANGAVVTIAGAGNPANAFADGGGEIARFAGQEGIAVSRNGKTIYVADGTGGSEDPTQQEFHRIRVITIP
jgi:DNA-binding beta-propeller fold protein YncE